MNNRIKVKTPRGIRYCQKEKSGYYGIYKTRTGGRKIGIINLDYLIEINDRCYKILD